MIIRIFGTTALAVFGIYGFWSDAVGGGHILNPFGIMFLIFSALVWFFWQTIHEAFKLAKDQSNIPIIRMEPTIIKGMVDDKRGEREYRRHSQ
jgi:hypothetical protein